MFGHQIHMKVGNTCIMMYINMSKMLIEDIPKLDVQKNQSLYLKALMFLSSSREILGTMNRKVVQVSPTTLNPLPYLIKVPPKTNHICWNKHPYNKQLIHGTKQKHTQPKFYLIFWNTQQEQLTSIHEAHQMPKQLRTDHQRAWKWLQPI